jgi:thiol-disulfide isomerase/thioredoxin
MSRCKSGWWLAALLGLLALPTLAELKPFEADSLPQILSERQNRPFLLLLWSLDCPPCRQEFARLQQLHGSIDRHNLVLIATDDIASQAEVQAVLHNFGLEAADNWIFADPMPERLRYRIDPNWFGELPRAYLYSADQQRNAYSGVLSEATLQQWQDTMILDTTGPSSVNAADHQ